jgi:hypothetical protein
LEEKINPCPVRLAYQPPASSNFLSEQISHQQPNEQAAGQAAIQDIELQIKMLQ